MKAFFRLHALSKLLALASASPLNDFPSLQDRTDMLQASIEIDFPDPSLAFGSDHSWYAFATEGNGHHIQVARAKDKLWGQWEVLDIDALPDSGPWTTNENVWAPEVVANNDGTWVMFYSGELKNWTGHHCVSTAKADRITGPYTPADEPLYCHLEGGGTIDPSTFIDNATQTRWLLYKVDGGSIGHGGDCNNGVEPIVPTPIMIRRMSSLDWTVPVSTWHEILDRTAADGPLVEAPNLHRTKQGIYLLTYSSHCFNSPNYDVKYAINNRLTGDYVRAPSNGSLITSGSFGNLTSPGGVSSVLWVSSVSSACQGEPILSGGVGPASYASLDDCDEDGTMVFHANCLAGRCMYVTNFTVRGSTIELPDHD